MLTGQPFFIFGNPRSGTSLLRLMINNHPEIIVPPECGFTEWLYDEFGKIEYSEYVYRHFLSEVFKARKFETWGLSYEELLSELIEKKPRNYQELIMEIYFGYARKHGKHVKEVGDKNNYYINKIEKIENIFPGCKKIFIVRDGRDVTCSYLDLKNKDIESQYKPTLAEGIADIARQWQKSVEVMAFWSEKGALSIRYEDLVVDPHGTLTKVCDFLSLRYSDKMLDYYNNNDEPEEFKAWKGKTFKAVETSSVARFKADLTRDQLQTFQSVAGRGLETVGYTLV